MAPLRDWIAYSYEWPVPTQMLSCCRVFWSRPNDVRADFHGLAYWSRSLQLDRVISSQSLQIVVTSSRQYAEAIGASYFTASRFASPRFDSGRRAARISCIRVGSNSVSSLADTRRWLSSGRNGRSPVLVILVGFNFATVALVELSAALEALCNVHVSIYVIQSVHG